MTASELFEGSFFCTQGSLNALSSDSAADWEVTSSEAAKHARLRSRLQSKLDAGKMLDVQSEPAFRSLLAASARFPQRRPHRHKQLPPQQQRQPASATLWGLSQPAQAVGITSAVDVREGSIPAGAPVLGGLVSFTQDGFIDISRRTSVEWSLSSGPACKLSGDLELSGILPKLPILGPITLRHRLALPQLDSAVRHTSAVSVRPFNSAGVLKAKLAQVAAGDQLTLELSKQSGSSSSAGNGKARHITAGGAKLPWANTCRTDSTTINSSSSSSDSDSDSEHCSSSNSSVGIGAGKHTGGAADGSKRRGLRIPCVRVDIPPTSTSARDLSWQWRQAWSQRSSTVLGFQAPSQQLNIELKHRAALGLLACSRVALDSGSRQVRRATAKLLCRVRRRGRPLQHFSLEACWAAGPASASGATGSSSSSSAGVGSSSTGIWTQTLRYRVGSRGAAGDQLRGYLELGLHLQGRRRAADIAYCLPF